MRALVDNIASDITRNMSKLLMEISGIHALGTANTVLAIRSHGGGCSISESVSGVIRFTNILA